MEWKVDWKGQKYNMEWFDSQNFENLKNVTQAYGFIFDGSRKVCIVDCDKGWWSLPGGHPEKEDLSFEETLKREVNEEADLDIKNIKGVGYFKVTPLSDNCERKDIHYLLRFAAIVDRIKEQTIDPDIGKIPKRRFVSPKEFPKFINWNNGNFQLNKAMEAIYGKSKI